MAHLARVIKQVRIRPYVYEGLAGYRVRFYVGLKTQAYFVKTLGDAKYVKQRLLNQRRPTLAACWALKIGVR